MLSRSLTSQYRLSTNMSIARVRAFLRKTLSFFIVMGCRSVWASDYFDPELLSLGANHSDVDLSAFASAGGAAEGKYVVTLFINQRETVSRELVFSKNAQGNIVAQLTPALLAELGVNVDHLPALQTLQKDKPVGDLAALIPQSTVSFDLSRLRLDISIPQVAMQPGKDSRFEPEKWDEGIAALLLNYSFSAGRNEQIINNDKRTNNNLFANAQLGANAGAWRLRSTITHSHYDSGGGNRLVRNHRDDTCFSSTYLSRDILAWRSQLTMGEASTSSEVLDGVPFRGVQLRSSEQMMPAHLRGFAPQITGVANSNARVTVRQNGYIVYDTYVAPGPFDIKDLYQAGMSGDLGVTVTEVDGSVHGFIVPYSSLPVMLRPGALKYELTAGQYSDGNMRGTRDTNFAFGTLIYGLPKNLTLYGGWLVSNFYTALSSGTGVSLGNMGALSADATLSMATFDQGKPQTGGSWRLRYSKSLLSTGTSVDLTALRYSTQDFYNFTEYNSIDHTRRNDDASWKLNRRQSSFQTQITQQLGQFGSISLRANRDSYRGSSKTLVGLSAGYNGSLYGISYGANYTIDRMRGSVNWPDNRQISFNMSIPFNLFSYSSAWQNTYASSLVTHDNRGRTQNRVGMSGSDHDGALSYSLLQGWGNQDQISNSSNLSMAYQGSKGNIGVGYAYSKDSRSMNVNMSGGVVAHAKGITFSRSLGSSVALVSTPGAVGVRLSNGGGTTDKHGYAVVPYLSNYTNNNIGVDPSTLPDNVDLPQNQMSVYPTNGAVVKANFVTRIGYQVLMTLSRKDSLSAVPFGATVSLLHRAAREDITSIVGDNGLVYLAGLPPTGELSVSWGKSADKQCRVSFSLDGLTPTPQMPVIQLNGTCR